MEVLKWINIMACSEPCTLRMANRLLCMKRDPSPKECAVTWLNVA